MNDIPLPGLATPSHFSHDKHTSAVPNAAQTPYKEAATQSCCNNLTIPISLLVFDGRPDHWYQYRSIMHWIGTVKSDAAAGVSPGPSGSVKCELCSQTRSHFLSSTATRISRTGFFLLRSESRTGPMVSWSIQFSGCENCIQLASISLQLLTHTTPYAIYSVKYHINWSRMQSWNNLELNRSKKGTWMAAAWIAQLEQITNVNSN